jgi:DNA invertase Pin-like site-specific DNA recombinase
MADARRRRVDVVVVWRLDRLRRNSKHLITALEELQVLGVAFVSLNEGIDATTPAGRLQMAVPGAIAQFERDRRIVERVRVGLARARAQGRRLGRRPTKITESDLANVAHLSQRGAAAALRVRRSVLQRARVARKPSESRQLSPRIHWIDSGPFRWPVKSCFRSSGFFPIHGRRRW